MRRTRSCTTKCDEENVGGAKHAVKTRLLEPKLAPNLKPVALDVAPTTKPRTIPASDLTMPTPAHKRKSGTPELSLKCKSVISNSEPTVSKSDPTELAPRRKSLKTKSEPLSNTKAKPRDSKSRKSNSLHADSFECKSAPPDSPGKRKSSVPEDENNDLPLKKKKNKIEMAAVKHKNGSAHRSMSVVDCDVNSLEDNLLSGSLPSLNSHNDVSLSADKTSSLKSKEYISTSVSLQQIMTPARSPLFSRCLQADSLVTVSSNKSSLPQSPASKLRAKKDAEEKRQSDTKLSGYFASSQSSSDSIDRLEKLEDKKTSRETSLKRPKQETKQELKQGPKRGPKEAKPGSKKDPGELKPGPNEGPKQGPRLDRLNKAIVSATSVPSSHSKHKANAEKAINTKTKTLADSGNESSSQLIKCRAARGESGANPSGKVVNSRRVVTKGKGSKVVDKRKTNMAAVLASLNRIEKERPKRPVKVNTAKAEKRPAPPTQKATDSGDSDDDDDESSGSDWEEVKGRFHHNQLLFCIIHLFICNYYFKGPKQISE